MILDLILLHTNVMLVTLLFVTPSSLLLSYHLLLHLLLLPFPSFNTCVLQKWSNQMHQLYPSAIFHLYSLYELMKTVSLVADVLKRHVYGVLSMVLQLSHNKSHLKLLIVPLLSLFRLEMEVCRM